MSGNLSFEDLNKAVSSGEIDTVLVCQVDMQGRLMGKRFHADYFVNGGHKETHSCNYLLATDMEMETVEGYKSTSWESGYGDYTMKPDLSTLRRVPWLEGTAFVMCDMLDHHTHKEVPHSPRAILKKQVARLEAMGMKAYMASELEFFLFENSFEDAQKSSPTPNVFISVPSFSVFKILLEILASFFKEFEIPKYKSPNSNLESTSSFVGKSLYRLALTITVSTRLVE